MAKKDHPELNTSDLLDSTGIKQYQSLIGALQWSITLGCFDIHISVTAMSGYSVPPPKSHLDCLKCIYGYVKRHPHDATQFCTKIPDHESYVTPITHDWSFTVYGNVKEDHPLDTPPPKGKAVCTSHYQDANFHNDMVTGCAMSGIFHLVYQTPSSFLLQEATDS
jgi:hypothetical protein